MMNPSQSPTPPIFRFGHFMKPWGSLKLTIFGLAALALPLSVLADEPAEKFVTALAENGYFDVAVEYLDGAQNDPLVDESYRKRIQFEKAKVLILSIPSERNSTQREEKLNEADRLLSSYSQQLSDADEKLEVVQIGANIKIKRAESYIAQTANQRLTAPEKQTLQTKAKELLNSARQQYQQARETLRTRIQNYQIDPEDPQSLAKKKRLQSSYIRVRTKLPEVTELIADTLPSGSEAQKKMLGQAVKENQDVYDDYSSQGAVFVFESAINGARAAQKAGDHKTTLLMLENVFFLGDGAVERRLKKRAMLVAADSWETLQPYPFETVGKLLAKPIGLLNRNEVRDPDWQQLQLVFGKAQLLMAADLKKKGGGDNASKARSLNRDAGKLVRKVARAPGPFRDTARALIEQFNLSFSTQDDDTDAKEIKTFTDAKEKSSELISEIADLQNEISQAKRTLPSITDATQKAQTEAMVEETSKMLSDKTSSALKLYEKALSLATEETARADINFIHYQRIICLFFQNKPLQSAVIAEFLLERYPTVDWSKQASAYIVNGYSALLAATPADDRGYEIKKLKSACSEICRRWPGSDEASRAASKITEIALRSGDAATAEEFFAQISDGWPAKNALAAALGQKLWFNYRTQDNLSQEQRQATLAKTQKLLTDTINASAGQIDYTAANSALTLVDVLLEQKQFDAALQRLESATIAPLDLVNKKHPAISDPRYAQRYRRNTYLTAVKAYLGSLGGGANLEATIDKATGIISALKSEFEASNDPKATAKLTAVYQSVAKQLKTQFQALETLDQRKQFATGLASFLGTIEQQSSDAPTVLWAGETLLDTASSLSQEGATADAQPLYKQAVSALDRAQTMGIQEPALQLKLRRLRALALRGSGDYKGAVDTLTELLKKKSAINLQIDAAQTLQMWGKEKSNKDAYGKAMVGTGRYKDGKREKNAVWGWRKLEKLTRGKPKLNDIYRESLYGSMRSQFEYSVLIKNKKGIQSALNFLEKSLQRFVFLKTGPWSKKFDDLVAEMKSNL
jgi:hypothetical protein